jgi:hypothetical protein
MTQLRKDSGKVPFPVGMAAILVWLHGLMLIVNAVATAIGMNLWRGVYQSLIYMIFFAFTGWSLLNLRPWAWWVTVLFGGLSALGSLIGVAALMFLESQRFVVGGGFNQIVLMLDAIFLVAAIFYLMRPVSRAAFSFGQQQSSQNTERTLETPPIPSPGPWNK